MKKRMQALLLALVLLWTVSIGSVTAQAAPAAAWRVEAEGDQGVITVRLYLQNGQGVTNGRVVLGYDAQQLTLTEARTADGMGMTSLNTAASGEIALAWVGSDITEGDVLMLTAAFSGDGTNAVITAGSTDVWSGAAKTEVAGDSQTVRMNPFVDISGHWAEEDILKVYYEGLFNGVSETIFAPDQAMNRAMFVTVLYRLAGEPQVDASELAFTDVPAACYYKNAVAWAVETGITNGVSKSLFAPDKVLNRQELVTMFYRYVKSTGADVSNVADLSSYADADQIAGWAADAFGWAVEADVIRGIDENTLSPKSAASRAQVAAILSRWLDL